MKKHTHKAERSAEFCSCGATRTNDGEWEVGKDPFAVALGQKATAMSTPEERQEKTSAGGKARWEGISTKQRREHMKGIASLPRPSARIEDRCECGRFSRAYAERHGHLCGKALEEKLKETRHGR